MGTLSPQWLKHRLSAAAAEGSQYVLQFCLDNDEVEIATQVFDHWRTEACTPAYIEV